MVLTAACRSLLWYDVDVAQSDAAGKDDNHKGGKAAAGAAPLSPSKAHATDKQQHDASQQQAAAVSGEAVAPPPRRPTPPGPWGRKSFVDVSREGGRKRDGTTPVGGACVSCRL